MTNEDFLLRALKKIFQEGDSRSKEIAEVAITEYRLRCVGTSFQNFRGSDFLKMIAQSDIHKAGDQLKALWEEWKLSLPYTEKPDLSTDQRIADWMLSDRISINDRSQSHYKTKVSDVYDYAQKMTTNKADWMFEVNQ